jgi:para-nitrobenzyl esterase
MSYWTNFAKNGDPNGPGLPVWPSFTGLGSQVMQLASATPAAGPNTDENRFAFIASYRKHGRFPEAWRTLGAPGNEYPGIGCGTATFHP